MRKIYTYLTLNGFTVLKFLEMLDRFCIVCIIYSKGYAAVNTITEYSIE